MDEYVKGNAFVGGYPIVRGQAVVGRLATIWGQAVVGVDESDEDVLLSDYSDKRASSDDDVNVESIQVKVDGATELTIVDEDSEGSEDHERDQSSYLESNLGDNLSNANKEVKRLINSFDNDTGLGTVQLSNYLQ